jgi:hypothetical protein
MLIGETFANVKSIRWPRIYTIALICSKLQQGMGSRVESVHKPHASWEEVMTKEHDGIEKVNFRQISQIVLIETRNRSIREVYVLIYIVPCVCLA